jgi:hypothetical protein
MKNLIRQQTTFASKSMFHTQKVKWLYTHLVLELKGFVQTADETHDKYALHSVMAPGCYLILVMNALKYKQAWIVN